MSAPVRSSQQHQQQPRRPPHQSSSAVPTAEPPFWHNPCGTLTFDGSGDSGAGHDPLMMETRREEEIMGGIVQSARHALEHVEQFAGLFVKRTFNMDIQQFHNKWKNVSVEWLQLSAYMPKELDVPLCACYMNGLKFPAILHPVNVGLQHVAVGLEQVAWDQGREHLPFAKYFKETTSKLKLVLCEVSNAIEELNDTPDAHVSRDVMPPDTRSSPHNRSLRDWLIVREYMASLQYVVETFDHLSSSDR